MPLDPKISTLADEGRIEDYDGSALADIFAQIEKAERKAYKAIKDFAALLEIGNGGYYTDWVEDDVKAYINGKRYYNVVKVADHCKYLAVNAARKIRY